MRYGILVPPVYTSDTSLTIMDDEVQRQKTPKTIILTFTDDNKQNRCDNVDDNPPFNLFELAI